MKLNIDLDTKVTSVDEAKAKIKELREQIEKVEKDINIKVSPKELEEGKKRLEALQRTVVEVEKSGGSFSQKFEKNLKDVSKESNKTEKAVQGVSRAAKELDSSSANGFVKLSNTAKIATYDIRKTETQLDQLKMNLQQGVGQTLAFGAINGIQQVISDSVSRVKELDTIMTDVSIVSGKTREEMRMYRDYAGEAAEELGTLSSKYLEAALIYEQQGGLAAQYAKDLGESTVVAANISRESTAVMSEYLTSTINGFQMLKEYGGEAGTYITDVLAKLGAASGSDLGEIATGLSNVANIARESKFEFEEISTMIATVSEVTRAAPQKVGNAFKSIITSFTQLREAGDDEINAFTGKVEKAFQLSGLGEEISLFDNGNLRDAASVMRDLGGMWDKMTDESKAIVSEAVAGKYQAETFRAFMENQERYHDLLDDAYASEGTSAQQQLVYMDSLEAKVDRYKNAWERASSAILSEDVYGTLLEQGTRFLNLIGDQETAFGSLALVIAPVVGSLGALFGSKFAGDFVQGQELKKLQELSDAQTKSLLEQKGINEEITKEKIRQNEEARKQQGIIQNLGSDAGNAYKKMLDERQALEEKMDEMNNREKRADFAQERVSAGDINSTGYDTNRISSAIKNSEQVKKIEEEINSIRKNSITPIENARKGLQAINLTTKDTQRVLSAEGKVLDEFTTKTNNIRKHMDTIVELQRVKGIKDDEAIKDLAVVEEIQDKINRLENGSLTSKKQHKKALQDVKKSYEELVRVQQKYTSNEAGYSKITDSYREDIERKKKEELNKAKGIAAREEVVKIQDEKFSGISKEDIKAEQTLNQNMIAGMEKASKKAEFVQNAVRLVSVSFSAIVPTVAAINSYLDETASLSDTIASTTQAIGGSLLFSGNPWLMMAGGLMTVTSLLADHFKVFESSVEKAKGHNEDVIKQFLSLNESSEAALSNIVEIEESYKRFEGLGSAEAMLANPDVDEETKKEYAMMSEKIAKARPELIKYYNDENVAILDLSQSYESLLTAQKEENVQSKGMLEKNRGSFLSQYSAELDSATSKQINLTKEVEGYKKAMEVARKEGDSTSLTKGLEGYSKSLSDLESFNNDLKKTRDAINVNIVSPFISANSAIEKFIANGDLTNRMKDFASTNINTEMVSDMIERGMSDGVDRYLINMESILNTFGELEEKQKGAGEEFLKTIEEAGVKGKVLMQQLDFSEAGETLGQKLKEATESFSTKAFDSMMREEIRGASQEEINRTKELKEELNQLGQQVIEINKNDIVDIGKINEVNSRIKEVKKEIAYLEVSFDGANKSSKEFAETFRALSTTPEGIKEGKKDLEEMYGSLELLKQASQIEFDNLTPEQFEGANNALNELESRFPGLRASISDASTDIQSLYEEMRLNINASVNAMFENDVEYYNKWVEINHSKLTELTGLNESELQSYGTLANLKSEIDAMSAKDVIEIAANIEEAKLELGKAGIVDFSVLESKKVSIGEIASSEYLSLWEKTFLSLGKMLESLGNGMVEVFAWVTEESGKLMAKAGIGTKENAENAGKKIRGAKSNIIDDSVKDREKLMKKREQEARDLIKEQFDEIGNSFSTATEFNLFDKRIDGLGRLGEAQKKNMEQLGADATKKEKDSKKEIKDLQLTLDEYYKLENKLKDISAAYAKANKEKSQLYGPDKFRAMEEEQRLMAEQAGVNQSYINKLRQEQNSLRGALSGSGFRFDGRGEITNLNEKLRQMEREANSLQGEAKEKAIERVKAVQEEAKRYSDVTFNLIPNKEQAIRDARATFAAIAKEKFEYKIKLQVDKDDLKNQAIEVVKEMQDTWGKLDEKNNLVGSQMKLSLSQIAMYEEELRKLQRDSQGMNENDRQEKIQELQKNILNATSKARASYKELIEIQKEFIKGSLDAINKVSERYQNVIDKTQLLIDKQRELYGFAALKEVEELFNIQEKAINENIDSLVSGQRWLIAYRDTLDKNTDSWKEANDQVNEMAKQIESQLIAKMDTLKKKFDTITEELFNKFDKGFGLFGLAGAEEEFDKLIKKQEEYFSGFEKATTIGGKISEINKEIEKTADPNRARELAAFRDEELKTLLAQENVSKDEYERALKLYDIKMKELAIEERRDAKRVAQLVRDSQGNMSYEYIREETADVSKDIDELQKAKNDLYEFDSNKVKEASREIFKIIADYQGKLKELQDMNLSPEEYKKQAQALLDAAQEAIKESQGKIGKWTEYMAKDGFASLEDMFKNANIDTSSLGVDEDMMKKISQALQDGTLTFDQMLTGDVSKFSESLGISQEEAQQAVKGIVDFIMSENSALSNALDESIKHWTDSAQENVNQLGNAYNQYITQATGVLQQYNAVTGDLNKLLNETTQASKQTQAQIDKQTQAMIATTRANDGASKSVKMLEERIVGKNGKGGLFGSMVQLVKHQNQELQPTMIRTGRETDVLAGKTKGAGNQYNYMYQESRRAYDQTRAYNQKNLAHSYIQFDTIANKAQSISNRYNDMGKQADTARVKSVNLVNELAKMPGWNNYGAASQQKTNVPKGGNGAYNNSYASGGYTGTWKNSQSNREGRMALLHQKELVLNEKDTTNMLEAVSITRDLYKKLNKQSTQRQEIVNNTRTVNSTTDNTSNVTQNVEVINNFTGDATKEAIVGAMDSILADVSTYVGKKK